MIGNTTLLKIGFLPWFEDRSRHELRLRAVEVGTRMMGFERDRRASHVISFSGAGGAWLRRLIDCNPATSYEDRVIFSKVRQPERQGRIGRSAKRPIQQQQSWRYLIEEENKWDA